MKRIKNFLKRNIKYVIAFILGTLVSIFGVYATSTLYDGDVVSYDSTNSGLKIGGVAVDNVQDAIDALYEKSLVCREQEVYTAIETCPDCVYSTTPTSSSPWYATWNTASQTPTVLSDSSLYTRDYITLNKEVFLGLKLNSSNQIEKAYACGIKAGTPFCIEGWYNNSKQSENKATLDSIFGVYSNWECVYDFDYNDHDIGGGSYWGYCDSNHWVDVFQNDPYYICNVYATGSIYCG